MYCLILSSTTPNTRWIFVWREIL